jgi:hypothetical protein
MQVDVSFVQRSEVDRRGCSLRLGDSTTDKGVEVWVFGIINAECVDTHFQILPGSFSVDVPFMGLNPIFLVGFEKITTFIGREAF